ncbi:sensor histidine kinase [Sulfobacillus thermosulfidooxidans]|uniref:sensor histidine kinase n=1 Tax=Sulfobacillus thermosulfidooxidans TaxID=28034 RepID=UPI0006B513B8|nr:HAMP domain-containing sensor histidine kinase [Sulfobacillus thermosulfidooxidans]
MGLAGRLTVSLIAALLVVFGLLGGSLVLNLSHHLVMQAQEEAQTVARQSAQLASNGGVKGQHLSLNDPGMIAAAEGRSTLYLQVSQGNNIVQRSSDLGRAILPIQPLSPRLLYWAHIPLWGSSAPLMTLPRGRVVLAWAPIWQQGHKIGEIEAAVSLRGTLNAIQTVGQGLLVVGITALVLASLVSALLVYRSYSRVRWLKNAVAQIRSGNDLAQRLNIEGPRDEVYDLAQAFNHMVNQLDESFQRQRLVVAHASHQLRTPIATAIGYANMLRNWGQSEPDLVAEGLEVIHEQLERLHRTIEAILKLAETDEAKDLKTEAIVLKSYLATWVLSQTIPVELDGQPNVTVRFHPDMFAELLNIFGENARRYGGGRPQLRIHWVLDDTTSRVILTLTDNGPGFPADLLPHLFHPFVKHTESPGSGLGLALARTIVERHGGRIFAANSPQGGAQITIVLPQLAS